MNSSAFPATAVSASSANAATYSGPPRRERMAVWEIRASATFWVVMTIVGQLVFVAYIALFFGRSAAQGQPELWNKVLQAGYASGATLSNSVLITHLLFAFVVTAGGLLQLVPTIRRRWPLLH